MRALLIRSLAFDPETFAGNSKSGDVLPTGLVGTRARFDLRLTFILRVGWVCHDWMRKPTQGGRTGRCDWIGSAASAPLHVCRDMDGSTPLASSGCDRTRPSEMRRCLSPCPSRSDGCQHRSQHWGSQESVGPKSRRPAAGDGRIAERYDEGTSHTFGSPRVASRLLFDELICREASSCES